MKQKKMYHTKQKEELLIYLKEKAGHHITVNDICFHFQMNKKPIGTTTVYRQLEHFIDEGLVKKYIIDSNSPACFEYIGEEAQSDKEQVTCFHCKCEKCGRLIHLSCEKMDEVGKHLLLYHKFGLNPARTVLYGVCEDCEEKE